VGLPDKIVALHQALDAASIPHAFGGALALAWCTQRARGTIDVDVNVFVAPDHVDEVVAALPDGVAVTDDDLDRIRRDGQTRLWWESTPVDVFFNTTPFHERTAARARIEPFMGVDVPFLACRDIAVFKAFFDRTKDWADLEEMSAAGTLDVDAVLGTLVRYLGGDDPRIEKVRSLAGPSEAVPPS
jgi:hypothetical protein